MTQPTCPSGYDCRFTQVRPHHLGPWWEGVAGTWVAILAIVALAAILITFTVFAFQSRQEKRKLASAERQRVRDQAHALAVEEQRTMQADAAKGDPEMLRLIRSET